MKKTKVFIASDHKGYKLKNFLISHLKAKHTTFELIDLGPIQDTIVDYPDYANKLCESLLEEERSFGILICNTGTGMVIAANRNSKIRAANCFNDLMAYKARQHNNANILTLGANIISEKDAIKITEVFLSTDFEGGRHIKRLEKLN